MSIIARLNQQLGDLVDEVTLPDTLRAQLDDAERSLRSGRHQDALDTAARVSRQRPGLHRAQLIEALALEAAERDEQAAQLLNELRVTIPGRLAQARIEQRAHRTSAALALLEDALRIANLHPDRFAVLLAIAEIHHKEQPGRAVPVLRQALRLQPDHAPTALALAAALEADQDLDRAILTLEAAESRALDAPARGDDPDLPSAHHAIDPIHQIQMALANALLRRNQPSDAPRAAVILRQLMHQRPDDPDLLITLARALDLANDPASARPLLLQAMATAPTTTLPTVHRLLAQVSIHAGDTPRALDSLRAAVAMDDSDKPTLQLYARLSFQAGLLDEAADAAQSILRDNPEDPLALTLSARCALRAPSGLTTARALLQSTLSRPMTADTHIAWAELALAEFDALRAAEHLRDAQMMQPEHPALPELLVHAYGLLAPSLSELPPAPLITAADLAPWLDELSSLVTRQPALHPHLPALHQLRRHLDLPLTVAIVGEFNAGKSTLINALLREQVLATGVLPTTPSIHVIRYGSRPMARWTDLNGVTHELTFAQAAARVKSDPESVLRLEFCFPHPDLLGVHFWDTPGFNAPDDDHEARALDALNDADAIIWLMDASQALSDSELQRIRLITAPQERLLVVINKIDRPGFTADDLKEVRSHIERGLRTAAGGEAGASETSSDPWAGMFALSGLRAFQQRQATEDDDPQWQAFEHAVRSTFFDRAARLKSFEVMRGLQRVARAVLENTAEEVSRVEELRAHVAQARRLIARFETHAESSIIPSGASQLDAQVVEHRQQLFRELQELRMPSRFGGIAPRALQADDQALLRRRAAEGMARLVRRAADALVSATSRTEQELITTMADLAVALGPVHGRTQRARLDAFLQAAAGAAQLFERGVVHALVAADTARIEAIGDTVLSDLDTAPDNRREGILLRWLPLRGQAWTAAAMTWCREYVAIAVRLCDHVDRDLDILALDLEHRIVRPFSMVASTTAHMLSSDESTKS